MRWESRYLGYIDAQILDRACMDLPIAGDMVDSGTITTQPERDVLAGWWTTVHDQL